MHLFGLKILSNHKYPGKGDIYVTESDMVEMMNDLGVDRNGDGRMDFGEFQSVTGPRIQEYFTNLYTVRPHVRSR